MQLIPVYGSFIFFFQCYGNHRDLHYPLRRQRQMCIRDRINSAQIGSTGYTILLYKDGKILSHPNKELLNKNVIDLVPELAPILKDQIGQIEYKYMGENKFCYYEKVPGTDWIVLGCTTEKEFQRHFAGMKKLIISILIILIFIVGFAGYYINNILISPLTDMALDLGMTSKELEHASNQMSTSSTQLAESSSEQAASLEETSATLTQTSACLLYTSPSPRDRQKSRMPSSA
eukprot:TRINITY_DN13105_c0_g1_i3.p2 TRINITY_DN13105_c0_g1~~TRINITY_DN13105_c0_g1_i3.p2  ORF type:complete len:232 (+),score=22.07 TRINITY_DN13105_c0_g1_i3:35-730(+)